MEQDTFFPFQFNLDTKFGDPRLKSIDNLNQVPNRRASRGHNFKAPVIFMQDSVVFPGSITPLSFDFGTPAYVSITQAYQDKTTMIGVYEDPNNPTVDASNFLSVGIEFAVGHLGEREGESRIVLVQCRRRVQIHKIYLEADIAMAEVSIIPEAASRSNEVKALMRAVNHSLETYMSFSETIQGDTTQFAFNTEKPGELADLAAASIDIRPIQRLAILLETNGVERLRLVHRMLEGEVKLLKLEATIHKQVQSELDKSQREMYLREQISKLQKELNDGKSSDPEIASLQDQLDALKLPAETKEAATKELERLKSMPALSPESGMVQTYLHWLLDLPWTEETTDNLDIQHAREVLEANHHALKKAKDRILEYLAVRSLKPRRNRQPILCFVGAPGTGKTSLGRSIAEAMERKFVRLSLGGVHDEAEIRGHRRTYLGALPGRILQTMKKAKVVNPLFMLDEIDKLNSDFQGDPAAALLEVLDLEQNNAFSDHYLEVPYDLSKVLFITTANTVATIPPALLDRMEVIDFPGYILEEKLKIARQFLISNQLAETGLEDEDIQFDDKSISLLIQSYTYEAGVRNLERQVGSVLRKLARLKSEGRVFSTQVTPEVVMELLGPVEYFPISADAGDEIGVATGLAWTENGGEIMPIEVLVTPGKGNLQLTGQLGEIMQESAQAALSYLKSRAESFHIPDEYFEEVDIHVHVPEGAIPKDGPSAGITLATALTSAVLGVGIHQEVAMTGEITLRGRVLPVGGVREKVLAAQRSGIKTVLLPRKNEKDLVDMPTGTLDLIEVKLIDHMDEVLTHSLAIQPVFSKPIKPKKSTHKKKDAAEFSDASEKEN
ncbi:MAG: endopeptidase La [Anaerolineaceae bacterium]